MTVEIGNMLTTGIKATDSSLISHKFTLSLIAYKGKIKGKKIS